jgi:hypothetical protein
MGRVPFLGAPLACLLAGAVPVPADTTSYPPVMCATLWEGYADVLGDKGERALAAEFRAASVRLIGQGETDTYIAERRPWIVDLMTAYIHDQDDQSRELFERLVASCGQLAADLPHITPKATRFRARGRRAARQVGDTLLRPSLHRV